MLVLTNLRIANHHLAVLANRLLPFFLINNINENVFKIIDFIFILKSQKDVMNNFLKYNQQYI
jgi:hypothetical protein